MSEALDADALDADAAEEWLGFSVESGGRFVYVANDYGMESYTVEQARGLASAILLAAGAAERGERLS